MYNRSLEEMVMAVQTFEALTDANGNLQFAETVRLPAHTKVFVVVPEQTISYAEIMPETHDVTPSMIHFPSVRVTEEGLTKRLVKTIVGYGDVDL